MQPATKLWPHVWPDQIMIVDRPGRRVGQFFAMDATGCAINWLIRFSTPLAQGGARRLLSPMRGATGGPHLDLEPMVYRMPLG
jgi:hypothetical protein